jgi:hypothetical protein
VVRRIVEEDVATPTSTVVHEDDGSWIGRTIVTLVILALLVAGAVWLVRALSDNDSGVTTPRDNIPNEAPQNPDTDNNNTVEPSGVLPS